MATTTNYGWDTPDDTDLVKDGAAAIRTLGSSVDTTTKNLNPQTTTGALAYRSSTANVNTALPIGTANQVLRVNSGGTAPEWATTADQTPLTTKGDLFGFDTADARIPIGTNGHILTADSTQSLGLKWAAPAGTAGLIHINTTTFSAVASQSVNDVFSATYDYYVLFIDATASVAGDDINIRMRVSGSDDTTSNYRGNGLNMLTTGTTVSGTNNNNGTSGFIFESSTADTGSAYVVIMNPFLAKTTQFLVNAFGGNRWWPGGGQHNVATSYTGFTLLNATGGGNTISGTLQVYGYDK